VQKFEYLIRPCSGKLESVVLPMAAAGWRLHSAIRGFVDHADAYREIGATLIFERRCEPATPKAGKKQSEPLAGSGT
jgi:hypothetical protein